MTATMTVVARRAGETIRRATAPRGVVPTAARPRVALYSHDGLGLGHIRRNLAIAHALAATASPDILLLTGAPGAVLSDRPEGCDIVSLPALTKDRDGGYAARHLSFGAAALTALRSGILTAALTSFRPDVLIVDKHPRGWNGELVAALTALRALGTRVVLGLRDVLDDAATTRREWQADDSASALEAWYDQVWVYGDRGVHDPLAELHVPARLREHVQYTGYLARGRGFRAEGAAIDAPFVLAMVGAGSDGGEVATAFLRTPMPAGHIGVLVTGPHMPPADRERVARLAATRPDIRVHEYLPNAAELVRGAAALIGMGGYNTVCEAMATDTPMLIVPRVRPRTEQLVRAEALADRGIADVLRPDELCATALSDWLRRAVRARAERSASVDLDGLARLPELFTALLPDPARARTDAARRRKETTDA